ncbi:hypothetical protein LCGC14_2361590, partial [marine sediment metagenome]
ICFDRNHEYANTRKTKYIITDILPYTFEKVGRKNKENPESKINIPVHTK